MRLDERTIVKAEDDFREYLRQRGLKFTAERRTLLRSILQTQDHFEPEELLLSLRHKGIGVGKATIYRTLPLLVDSGILRRAFLGRSRSYYEVCLGTVPHDHMVCTACGTIIEFDSSEILQLRQRLTAEAGFQAESHRFQIAGLCSRCRAAGPSTPCQGRDDSGRWSPSP